ncbi:ATP synthase subunit I [Moraxella sp.]|uniref:ATP synthase subunit I n=1 Tax=Moraxella sp. TaxID=479 RepID=UPI0026DB46B9|nr:ATP synthase subunit I [Moraxella sp.]MDO4894942.1 ATP synthase subunit I [Moraxella sp.]
MRPAKPNQKHLVQQAQRQQRWLALGVLAVVFVLDIVWWHEERGLVTKGMALGMGLAYLAHHIFTWFAYKDTSVRHREQIVHNLYLGQMLKWAVSLLGFAAIFWQFRTDAVWAVIVGYFAMQLLQAMAFLLVKNKI